MLLNIMTSLSKIGKKYLKSPLPFFFFKKNPSEYHNIFSSHKFSPLSYYKSPEKSWQNTGSIVEDF